MDGRYRHRANIVRLNGIKTAGQCWGSRAIPAIFNRFDHPHRSCGCPRVREVDIGQIFQDVGALVGAGNPGAGWGDRWQLKGLRETRVHLDREGPPNSRRRLAGHFLFVLWNQQMEMCGTRCVAGAMHSRHRILWDDREARVFLSRNTKVLSLGHNLRRCEHHRPA